MQATGFGYASTGPARMIGDDVKPAGLSARKTARFILARSSLDVRGRDS
jgi:hypothetical protein